MTEPELVAREALFLFVAALPSTFPWEFDRSGREAIEVQTHGLLPQQVAGYLAFASSTLVGFAALATAERELAKALRARLQATKPLEGLALSEGHAVKDEHGVLKLTRSGLEWVRAQAAQRRQRFERATA